MTPYRDAGMTEHLRDARDARELVSEREQRHELPRSGGDRVGV